MSWSVYLAMGLAVGEPLLLGVLFDARELVGRGPFGLILSHSGHSLMLLAGIATALAVLWSVRRQEFDFVLGEVRRHPVGYLTWLTHAVAFVLLFFTTQALFGLSGFASKGNDRPLGAGALGFWIAAAAATGVTLARCVLPFGAWFDLARRSGKTLALGGTGGIVAFGLGSASDEAWPVLSDATLTVVAWLLHLVEPEVVYIPARDLIGTPWFYVTIAPECSGLAGMGAIAAFGVLLLVAARRMLRVGRVALLIPAFIALVWGANAVRIAALIVLGAHVSPAVALGGFHSKAGWFFFCVVALGLVAVVLRFPFFLRNAPVRGDASEWNPTLVYLLPLGLQIGVAMVTGMFAAGVDHAYGLRTVVVVLALLALYRFLPRPRFDAHWTAFAFGVVGYLLWIGLEPTPESNDAVTALSRFGTSWMVAWVVIKVLGSVVVVPIAEELAFRGFLLPRLIAGDFLDVPPRQLTVLALLGSSIAFGVLHDRWLAGTLCGVLFALARQRRGRLSDAIYAHGTANLLVAGDVLVRGNWHLWF